MLLAILDSSHYQKISNMAAITLPLPIITYRDLKNENQTPVSLGQSLTSTSFLAILDRNLTLHGLNLTLHGSNQISASHQRVTVVKFFTPCYFKYFAENRLQIFDLSQNYSGTFAPFMQKKCKFQK